MSEMIERVARAICAAADLDWEAQSSFTTSANGDDDGQEFYLAAARAAIEAMRQPTEPMVEAYCRAHERLGFVSWANASHVMPAMIDAALSSEVQPVSQDGRGPVRALSSTDEPSNPVSGTQNNTTKERT